VNKKKIIIIIIIAVVAISIGLYTILPLFTNTVINEPLPTATGLSLSALGVENFLKQIG
jgi:flagellar basal body-associated protein FliL